MNAETPFHPICVYCLDQISDPRHPSCPECGPLHVYFVEDHENEGFD